MAFKMKGSSYKMGGHKTKTTMAYMKSPLEQEMAAATEPVEEKVNPHGDWRTNQQAAIWKAINVGDPEENHANLQNSLRQGHYDDNPQMRKKVMKIVNALQGHLGIHGKGRSY